MTGALATWAADAAGPLVVKELRQGLRGRAFAIFFGLLLLTCWGMATFAWAFRDGFGSRFGQQVFTGYLWALGAVGWFIVPFSAFRGLAREREEETWVLLVLTGLSARRIVLGKFSSALGQAALYVSACAPFVVFSYYLNGVDVPQVLTGLALSLCWSVLLTAVGLGLATQARSRAGRAVTQFAALVVLAGAALLGAVFSAILAHEGARALREPGFVAFCVGVGVFCLLAAWVVLEGAAAALALPTEAGARPPRFALLCLVLAGVLLGAVLLGMGLLTSEGALAFGLVTSLTLLVAGAFATSEEDGCHRVRPGLGWWDLPGALRSTSAVLLLLLAATAIWFLLMLATGSTGYREGRSERTLVAGAAYVALYLSLGAFLGRSTPLARWGTGLGTRIAFLASTLVGVIAPPLLAGLARGRGNDTAVNVFNPVVGMINFLDRIYDSDGWGYLTLLLAVTAVVVVLGLAALAARDGEHAA